MVDHNLIEEIAKKLYDSDFGMSNEELDEIGFDRPPWCDLEQWMKDDLRHQARAVLIMLANKGLLNEDNY